jgi:indolepyruvate ferredoxin oxidoreductase beta subunit
MIEAARYCARAMSYDDIIRVADLKTRASRITRIRGELKASTKDIVEIEEYFHPGLLEVCGMCPKGIGQFVLESPKLSKWLDQRINKGRRIHTHTVLGYLSLRFLASLKGMRRASLRHADEIHTLEQWLKRIERQLGHSHELAKQTLLCQRLIKGYSDTHKRSRGKFVLLMNASEALEHHENGPQLLKQLRELALKEIDIKPLEQAINKLGISSR